MFIFIYIAISGQIIQIQIAILRNDNGKGMNSFKYLSTFRRFNSFWNNETLNKICQYLPLA